MSIRNWRDWFVPPEEVDEPTHVTNDQVEIQSGARHREFDKLDLKKRQTPRCAKCKRYMGYNDGMYIIVSGDWRIHIHCFSEVLERHFENGEVIDLTTGNIVKIRDVEISVD